MRLVPALLLLAAAGPPRGTPTPRPQPNRGVVRQSLLDAGGVTAQVASGVAAREEGGRVTLLGPVEIVGRLPAGALGSRVARDADVFSPGGERLGTIHAGTLVGPTTRNGARVVVDVSGPVRARVALDPAVLTVEPVEFVWPEAKDPRWEAQTQAPLYPAAAGGAARATLAELTQVQVREDRGDTLRVRTYGELELDGFVSKKQFEAAAGPPVRPPPPTGLSPTHEALVDSPLFADGGGKKRIGQLRGGALVTAGKDVAGPRRQVMTHGSVVVEAWVTDADLRPVDAKNWTQGL
jgi:hypothetical protein